ncbi:MAG: hypothetical protein R3C14_02965 [Caldilineaceae bacterium]
MTTMTIEFPDILAHQLHDRGITEEQLQAAILQFVQFLCWRAGKAERQATTLAQWGRVCKAID